MITKFGKQHKESYINNCTFLVNTSNGRPPLFSDNEKWDLVVKLDKVWLIDEDYLTEELKDNIRKAVSKNSLDK